jgi:hypothetical protein
MAPEGSDNLKRMFDIRRSELDDSGDRLLSIDMPALRTHAAEVQRVIGHSGPFSLRYEARSGEHVHSGPIDVEEARFFLRFRRGVDPDGVWQVRVEAVGPDESWVKPLWSQWLFVQSALRRSAEVIDELAQRYAPIFVFSEREKYFPVSLRTLLRARPIRESDEVMKIKTIFGKESIPLSRLGEFMRFNGHSEYLLDFNVFSMKRSVFASLGGDPRDAVIYYSYIEDPGSERFFITYHQIYAYDTKTGLARITNIGPHVFDRESMILVFEGSDRPSSMIISGHLENQTIFFLGKLKRWSQGRIRVPFDDERTLKFGDHPVIAVGEGSHALYPTSGEYQLSLLREIAGYVDRDVIRGRPSRAQAAIQPTQVLSPPSLGSGGVPTYGLRSLGLDRLTSRIRKKGDGADPYRAFLVFSGYWVDVPGTQNARFPPFTRNMTEIADWVDGAYEWIWDDVPESYHQNNGLILRFLRENLEDF